MLYNIPIEPIEERYSKIWNAEIPDALKDLDVEAVTVLGNPTSGLISTGQFLDVFETLTWKLEQLKRLVSLIHQGGVKDGDVLFFHDLWFPGLEQLFYLRDAMRIKFKIAGMFHAGTWDPWDYLSQLGMETWAKPLEECWLRSIDAVFVATKYHRSLITSKRISLSPIIVCSFPRAWPKSLETAKSLKTNLVVFSHRLSPEKDFALFDKTARTLSAEFLNWSFLRTKDNYKDKRAYYGLLLDSSIAVSCAKQETWGIAMQEAVIAGCIPLVPDDLSYVELFPPSFKYQRGTFLDSLRALMIVSHLPEKQEEVRALKKTYIEAADASLPSMVSRMRSLGWNL